MSVRALRFIVAAIALTSGYRAAHGQAGLPVVDVFAVDNHAAEGGDPAVFRITRTGSTASPLAVYFLSVGSAQRGLDYTLSSTSPASVPAGSSFVDVVVTAIDDSEGESEEGVFFQLSA